MKFSIIIPCKEIDNYVEECMSHCLNLNHNNYEIILLPNEKTNKKYKKTKIIPTGKVKPSIKRNIAAKESKADVLAFIDSDAYPDKDWLKNAEKYLKKEKIGAVGGPNLTPENDNILQKASGDILSSSLTGRSSIRYKIMNKPLFVKELPSCNLLIKKQVFNKTKGYISELLTAEDTKLCFDIIDLGKKILYIPNVIVYHHRRFLFRPHLKQMFIYGRDVAYLIKKQFSFDKLYYSLLSIFTIYLFIGLILSFFYTSIKNFYLITIFIYLLLTLIHALKYKRFFLVFPGLILTHIHYGIGFLYGLITKEK